MQKNQIAGRTVQICLIFCVGLLIGCLFQNLLWKMESTYYNYMLLIGLDQALENQNRNSSFFLLLAFLGSIYLLLILSGLGKVGKIFGQGIALCTGTMLGSVMSLVLLGRGMQKMFDLFLHGWPAFFISTPALLMGIILTCNMSTEWKITAKQYKSLLRKYVLFSTLAFAAFLLGIFLLCYVNPILEKILQKF